LVVAASVAILKGAAELGLVVKPELTATMGNYFEAGEKSMMQRGYDAAMMLMQKSRDFTAVLAFNDVSAVGAIRAIQDRGLSVPGNVSVVGMDDIQIAAFISPRLTTIRQPLKQMGAIAATTLLQRIQGEEIPLKRRWCNRNWFENPPSAPVNLNKIMKSRRWFLPLLACWLQISSRLGNHR